jgi:hypothetical protein
LNLLAERICFSQAETCADRATVLAAVADVEGLDAAAAAVFLETDELVDEVWESYGRMIRHFGITEIPVFSFSRPGAPSPFSPAFQEGVTPQPYIVVGSASVEIFGDVLGRLHGEWLAGCGPVDPSEEGGAALRARYLGRRVALQDGREGMVREVEAGGSLIIDVDGKLVRLRTQPSHKL